ncbi:MAG: YidC/Oxa1 family membrane protein insertase [Oscillospiraceae bacterium]|nr:YidC/Oxa1 family membrane protein insertase [Oscillospiraceae bacterium]
MDFIIIPFGWLMKVLYNLVNNYGIALLLFTLVTRIVMLPLSIKQQKSMAKMTVYNPLIQEVQKKYANNREKMNEEMTKLYTEYDIKPTMGCGPMIVQMAFVMVLYEVIRKPLRFFVGLNSEVYSAIVEKANTMMTASANTFQDAFIISNIQNGGTDFIDLIPADMYQTIMDLDFTLFGLKSMDLTQIPEFGWNLLMIIPLVSAISMIASQFITGLVTGQKLKGVSGIMMYGMSIWIGWLGFTLPAALSLYWFYSNVIGLVQSMVLRKFYSPEKFKEQIQAELEAKRAEKKRKKTVTVTDSTTGEKVEKNLSEAEIAKLRLARARELQAEKFRKMEEASRAAAEAAAAEAAAQDAENKNEQN